MTNVVVGNPEIGLGVIRRLVTWHGRPASIPDRIVCQVLKNAALTNDARKWVIKFITPSVGYLRVAGDSGGTAAGTYSERGRMCW
jgi:hypothetical protein